MKTDTYISSSIDAADSKIQYDEYVKSVLKDKQVLAHIMIHTTKEFADYTVDEAMAAIDGEPEVSSRRVRPDAVNALENESKLPGEGAMYFDIVFYAMYGKKQQKLYINVEAQKSFYPGYDIVTRGIIYPARLISKQMAVEYTADNYDGVKKSYSIWICMNAPKKNRKSEQVGDTIIKYSIEPKLLYPLDKKVEDVATGRYDLFSTVFINLNGDNTIHSQNELISMLSTLLSATMKTDEKKELLEKKYNFTMSEDLGREVNRMCNLSDAIYEQGMEQGIELGELKAMYRLIQSKVLTSQNAADSLGITPEQLIENMSAAGYTISK